MKQISIVLIALSAALGIFTHLSHQIHLYYGQFEFLYPGISIYMRYGDLTLMLGFFGLFLSDHDHMKQRYVAMLLALIIVINFMLIDFNAIEQFGLTSSVLVTLKLILLSIYIIEIKKNSLESVINHHYILIGVIALYDLIFVVLSLFFQPQITINMTSTSGTIITFFFILFQMTILIIFKGWYTESYIHQKEV